MASNNDKKNNNNDDDGNNSKKGLTNAESYIVEMLKKANLGSSSSDDMSATQTQKRHLFWETQPMPHDRREEDGTTTSTSTAVTTGTNSKESSGGEMVTRNGPVVADKSVEEIRATPYNMPAGFEWVDLNIMEEGDRNDVYELSAENYVEDDDCLFRFDYSKEFLLWALTPPGYRTDFHVGVKSSKSGKLMALITAVPADIQIYTITKPMVEINFLCVHKKLRSKRLAPVLIKEITRRVNLAGMFQAVYTAGVVLPVPISSCRYYHRSLNPKKLVDIHFSRLHPRMTMARLIKLYKLPPTPSLHLVPLTMEHVPSAHDLLMNQHLNQFPLYVKFSQQDFAHWLLPRPGVIDTYIVLDHHQNNKVTDMVSF